MNVWRVNTPQPSCGGMAELEIGTLYLLKDHDAFYERYGWRFLRMV